MALEKAMIQPLNAKGHPVGKAVPVLFNPTEYTIEHGNQYQTVALPGLSVPAVQFVNGDARVLTMNLLFDTYEQQKDVRQFTDKVMSLLEMEDGQKAPPVCKFIWGKLEFKAVIEKVVQRFTMFLGSGIPVRATLTVTFKEYKTMGEQVLEKGPSEEAIPKEITVKSGDTLWAIADREYGDPGKWRDIAKANGIKNPQKMKAGTTLKIPPSGG